MKKNLIVLIAFGAFSGAALAQSNVTLYGLIDVNFQYNDPKGAGQSSTRGVNSGHQSGSLWGVRGSEALGGGWSAVFTLEGGYSADTGVQAHGGRLFGRQAWAGLASRFGTVVAGRVSPFSAATGSFDLFANATPFVLWGDSSLSSTFTSVLMRIDNSVLYRTPNLGGFQFGAGYSSNANGTEAAGSGNNNRVTFLGANFTRGPFFAVVTYDIIDVNDAGIAGSATTPAIFRDASDQTHLQIGAAFDLKFLKIHGAYARERNVYLTTTFGIQPDAGADADAWMLGVTVPLLGGQLLAAYQDRDGDPARVCLAGLNAIGICTVPVASQPIRERDLKVWAVGYAYPLSRRTNLYANVSDRNGEKFVNNDATIDRRQYTVGLRHLF
ncbi:MAG: porin [Anaerolineae bacterium]|nr:porin [Phycisphaerae bacterium]